MLASELEAIDARAWHAHAGMFAWPTVALLGFVLMAEAALWAAALTSAAPLWLCGALCIIPAYLAFTIAHEAAHENIHGSATSAKLINDLCGWISGAFLCAPYEAFRVIHLTHHAHTNDPARDPDHWVVGDSMLAVFARCWTILPHYYYDYLWGPCSQSAGALKGRRLTIFVTSLGALMFGVGCMVGLGPYLIALWILPAIAASGLLAIAFDWLPHRPHTSQERFHDTRIVLNPALTLPLLWQNYHLIHHLYPRVPFYRYGTCFDEVRPLLEAHNAHIQGGSAAPPTASLSLIVREVTRASPDFITVSFAPVSASWRPGQHLALALPVRPNGPPLWRCYSICDADTLKIGVRRLPQGQGSTWLHEQLQPGDTIIARPPSGDFIWEPATTAQPRVFIAGGSGITPIIAMIQAALARSQDPLTLIYGARTPQFLVFKPELDALARRYPERLQLIYGVDQPLDGEPWRGHVGRLDGAALSALLASIEPQRRDAAHFYSCGPEAMMAQVELALDVLKIPQARRHAERFGLGAPTTRRAGEVQPLTLTLSGRTYALEVRPAQTILEAALEANAPITYACRSGRCGSCVLKLKRGQLETRVGASASALHPDERAAGLFLPCISHADGPCEAHD